MNSKDKKYILENIGKKSTAVIAKEEKSGHLLNKKLILVSLILIVIFGSISYTNSLRYPFIWDDKILIVDNPVIKDARNIPLLFQREINYRTSGESNFYRPLQMLVYTLDYVFGKLDVRLYRASSITFHIFVALMLYWLAWLIFKNTIVPFVASILFVTHPIHTEAVVYISGIADPLAAFFMLSGTVFYIKYTRSEKRLYFYILCLLSFLLALLSKEIAIVFPLLLMAYDRIYKGKGGISLKRHASFLLLAALYIFLRNTILNFPVENIITESTTLLQRLPAVFQSLFTYIVKLLLPLDLHMEYQTVLPSITDPRVIIGMVLSILLIWAIMISAKKDKAVSFMLVWFLIQYLPISNIFPLNAFFAEHWIYTPSFGLFILLGWFIFKISERRRLLRIFILSSVVAYACLNSYLTIKQNKTWSDAGWFFKRILKYNPRSPRAHYNLGNAYGNKGNHDQAILEYTKAIELEPNYAEAYNNLGSAYGNKGNYDQAILEYTKAIELNPNLNIAYNNRAVAYYYKHEYDRTRVDVHKAGELGYKVSPHFLEALKKASGREK